MSQLKAGTKTWWTKDYLDSKRNVSSNHVSVVGFLQSMQVPGYVSLQV